MYLADFVYSWVWYYLEYLWQVLILPKRHVLLEGPMDIWMVSPDLDGGCGIVAPVSELDWRRLSFDGRARLENFEPLTLKQTGGHATDFLYLKPGILVCRRSSWGKIQGQVTADVEVLPATLREEVCDLVNVTNVVNCLDLAESVISYWPHGAVRSIDKYVFNSDAAFNFHLFRLPQSPLTPILATQRFRDLIESTRLTGLSFDPPISPLQGLRRLAAEGAIPKTSKI